jgi:uncharacterized protein (TIGR03067 family)
MSAEPSSAAPAPSPSPLAASRAPASPRRRKRLWLALSIVALSLVSFVAWRLALYALEPKDDPGRFQGQWRLAVPAGTGEKSEARLVPGVTIRVSGDRWVWLADGKEQRRYRMELRPDASPKEIDLVLLAEGDRPRLELRGGTMTPVTLRGIYSVERGKAKVVAAVGGEARPTSLDAADGVTVWLLERQD